MLLDSHDIDTQTQYTVPTLAQLLHGLGLLIKYKQYIDVLELKEVTKRKGRKKRNYQHNYKNGGVTADNAPIVLPKDSLSLESASPRGYNGRTPLDLQVESEQLNFVTPKGQTLFRSVKTIPKLHFHIDVKEPEVISHYLREATMVNIDQEHAVEQDMIIRHGETTIHNAFNVR